MAGDRGTMSRVAQAATDNPAVERVREQASSYAHAWGQSLADKIESATERLQEHAEGGGALDRGAMDGVKAKAQGAVAGVATVVGTVTNTVRDRLPGAGGEDEPTETGGRRRRLRR